MSVFIRRHKPAGTTHHVMNSTKNKVTSLWQYFLSKTVTVGCVAVVERWSLTGELSLSCARPAAYGDNLWVNCPL